MVMPAASGLPLIGAQAVLLGMGQFNLAVAQVTRGLVQIGSTTKALESSTLLATSRITAGFNNMSRGVGTASAGTVTALGTIGTAATAMAATITAAAVATVAASANLERALKPAVIFGGLTPENTQKLTDSIITLSNQWGISTSLIAEGATELTKAGVSFEDLQSGVLKAATALSIASKGELNMAESSKLLVQILKTYNLPVSEAARITDELVAITDSSTASYTEMRQGLGQTLALFAKFNIPLKEGAINLGILNDANIRGERAGSAYRNLLLRLLDPASDVAAVMLRYGVSLQDTNGHMISARQFIERLSDAFSANALAARGIDEATANADLATLGMSRSLLGAATLAQQGTAAYDKYDKAVANSSSTQQKAQQFTDTTIKQAERLFININNLAAVFGTAFNNSLRESLRSVNDWFATLDPEKVRAFGTMLHDDIAAGFTAATTIIREQITNLQTLLNQGVNQVAAIDITPYIKAAQDVYAQAIIIINTVITTVQQTFNNTLVFITNIVNAVGQTVSGLVASIVDTANSIVTIISDTVGATADAIGATYTNIINFVNGILKAIEPITTALSTQIPGSFEPTYEAFKTLAAVVVLTGRIIAETILIVAKIAIAIGTAYQDMRDNQMKLNAQIGANINLMARIIAAVQPIFSQLADNFIAEFNRIVEGVVFVGDAITAVLKFSLEGWGKAFGGLGNFIEALHQDIMNFIEWLTGLPIIGEAVRRQIEAIQAPIRAFTETRAAVSDFFDGIVASAQDTFNKIRTGISNIPSTVSNTFNDVLSQIDIMVASIGTAFSGVGGFVTTAFDEARATIERFLPTLSTTLGTAAEGVYDFINGLLNTTQRNIAIAVPAVQAYLEKIQNALNNIRRTGITGPSLAGPGNVSAVIPGGPGADDTVGFPVDQTEKMIRFVQQLLKDMPGVNREFAEWIAKLVAADPNRLTPIVNALKSQIPLVREILEARRNLLQTELEIEKTNERIAAINLQMQRIDIQSRQAVLPMEQELLELNASRLRIQLDMLPIQQQIAAIDQQIALLQRENLTLTARRLQLQQQALPIQNAIADMDLKIAEINRTNYDLERERLETQLEMLPIQNAIEDVQRRIQDLHKEDYALTRQILQAELALIPINRQIADIDRRIQDAQRDNYDLIGRRLQLEQQSLGLRNQISDIDARINSVQRTNYDLVLRRAQAEEAALPGRQRIALIEEQIANSIDRQRLLTLQRNELVAQRQVTLVQRQLDDTERQLTALWAQFNLQPTGSQAASLVPQILNLEAERTRLQGILSPTQQALTDIQRQQEDITFQQELTNNTLQQQLAAEQALLAPIEARIRALAREEETANARNAVILVGLQQQKQRLEDLLLPYTQQIEAIDRIQEASRLQTDITVNGLNRQKQLLQDLARPYTDQLNRLREIQTIAQLTSQIQETALQEELQRLQALIKPLEDHLTAVKRISDAEALRRDIAVNGLNQQKSRLEDLLAPINAAILAVDREREAERLRNDIAVNGLEQQKRKLEDLLLPMQQQLTAIQNQIDKVTLQRDLTTNAYDQMKLRLEALKLAEELYANTLEGIRVKEQTRLNDLVQKYKDALIASGAFTRQEAEDAITRLGLWDGEKTKVSELKGKIDDLNTALGNTAGGFRPLPTPINDTETQLRELRDLISDSNNGVNKVINSLATAIGTDPNSGVQGALKSLNTALTGGVVTNMRDLRTALGEAATNTGALYEHLGNLANLFNFAIQGRTTQSVKQAVADVAEKFVDLTVAANSAMGFEQGDSGGGVLGVWNATAGFAQQSNNIVSDMRKIADSLASTDYSIAHRANLAKDAVVNLRDAINAVINSTTNLSDATAKYMATQAVSIAVAINQFNVNRQTMGLADAAHWAYISVIDRIRNRDIGFAEGGVVPGPYNQAQWAIVHGGERVVPTSAGIVEPMRVSTGQTVNNYNVINNTYNFSASYERVQDPVTLSADVRSIIEMSRR